MRFTRDVHAKPACRLPGNAVLAYVPVDFRSAGGPSRHEADEVGHIAAAHEQPSALDGITNERRDPPHRLRFELGRSRRERPCADVRVHRGGEEIAKDSNRGGRRRDVVEEARMSVEQRVIEQRLRGPFQERRGLHAHFREWAGEVERFAHRRR